MSERVYRTYARVDLGRIAHNGKMAREKFPKKKILSVLKADAYGHGISDVVPAYETFTDWYAVATVEEGLKIRAQSEKPILVFGPIPEGLMVTAAEHNLTLTVGSVQYAETLSAKLSEKNVNCDCHLKIDTGLNRSGLRFRDGDECMEEVRHTISLPHLNFTGTYTHFACGEGTEAWELAFTKMQFERFKDLCARMEKENIRTGLTHCTSTGGSLVHPEYQLDMVRLGMMPLGMSYTDESVEENQLQPAMTWVSYIAQISEIEKGEAVSYGCTFKAQRNMRIAMVTCGYADGYRRTYSNKSYVLTGGKRVPVIGRIAMDYTMIDITDAPDAQIGSEVILLGSDGVHSVSAQELSQWGESVSGEVTAAISARVPRIYTK